MQCPAGWYTARADGVWGEENTRFHAINDRGLIGGTWLSEGKYVYGYYKKGNLHFAGLSDRKLSLDSVVDINNNNQLVGRGYTRLNWFGSNGTSTPVLQYRAVIYDLPKGKLRDLGVLPAGSGIIAEAAALRINDRGIAVGFAQNRSLNGDGTSVARRSKAVTFSAGKAHDLNKRLENHFDLHLQTAADINEQGDIVVQGITNEGFMHAVMLLPTKKR